jgi:hypothetical protein
VYLSFRNYFIHFGRGGCVGWCAGPPPPGSPSLIPGLVLVVADFPQEDPIITGVELQYQIGDEITLNCTSGKSHPASILHWYINEQQVQYKSTRLLNGDN